MSWSLTSTPLRQTKSQHQIDGAIAITADVADETQVENLVARTVSTFGQLNVVVPNAGIANTTPLTENLFADWRKVMSVNLDGVFLTHRHALPELLKPGGGSIVTISSISGTTGSPLHRQLRRV